MERYIEYFNGYRNAYGVADFNHQDSKVDSETGKKKPVYRWNFEELTNDIYQQHIKGELSIGIQPCTEDSEGILETRHENARTQDREEFACKNDG